MRYASTRGEAPEVDIDQVLTAGTAPDGGLYVPKTYPYPQIILEAANHWTYADLATHVLYPYVKDIISFELLDEMTHAIYTEKNFGSKEITPLEWLEEGIALLQLANGPTLAFKDLAMMLVARLMEYVLKQQGRHIVVIVSTSGDTGGAAVEAFRGLTCVDLVVLFPKGRVSKVQQRMMTTSATSNIHALSVEGTFDDCQAIVKALFDNRVFCEKVGLAAVNSINWMRIAAQVVYWASCGVQMLQHGHAEFIASVPSGNFGDADAAHIARESGIPIRTIVVATNQNDVLYRLFMTGIYRKGKKVLPSSSPSMDIQVSSNVERFLFDISQRRGKIVDEIYSDFARTGECDVRFLISKLGTKWASGSASEADVGFVIRQCLKEYGRMIDPHTAVGMFVGRQHRVEGVPLVVAETAKPEKFPDAIKRATGVDLVVPEAWKHLETLPEKIHEVGTDPEEVKRYILDRV